MRSNLQDLFKGANQHVLTGVISKLNEPRAISLTELEKEISVLIWMNFDHYEIAQLLNIELADVELERECIREKLALDKDQSIQSFIHNHLA